MENANEKVLAESKLCNIALMKKVLYIAGIAFFLYMVLSGLYFDHLRLNTAKGYYRQEASEDYEIVFAAYRDLCTAYEKNNKLQSSYSSAKEYAVTCLQMEHNYQREELQIAVKGIKREESEIKTIEKMASFLAKKHYNEGLVGSIYHYQIILNLVLGAVILVLFILIGHFNYKTFENNSVLVKENTVLVQSSRKKKYELSALKITRAYKGVFWSVVIVHDYEKIRVPFIKNREKIVCVLSDLVHTNSNEAGELMITKRRSTAESGMVKVDTAQEIQKFKSLLDSGAITQEEYDAKKKQILGL